MTKTKVAFIGLGAMGFPMAGHLAAKGYDVCVYNRSAEKAQKWAQTFSGRVASSLLEAAQGASFVFTCVGNDDDLRSVVLGEGGLFRGMEKGAILVDHTTTSAVVAKELDGVAKSQGLFFLDAPISGGQPGAEKGILTIMVGGEAEAYARAEPAMRSYARSMVHVGGSGAGQLTKMVNQICIAGIVQSLAEGLRFGQKAGLDLEKVITAIGAGSAASWWMANRSRTMAEGAFDFGFAVDWFRKDLGICLDEARRNGASLPIVALIDQFYADLQREGGGRLDASSLIKRLK